MQEYPPSLKIRYQHEPNSEFSPLVFSSTYIRAEQAAKTSQHPAIPLQPPSVKSDAAAVVHQDSLKKAWVWFPKIVAVLAFLITFGGVVIGIHKYTEDTFCNQDGSDSESCVSPEQLATWVDVSSDTNGFDLDCEYEWRISQADSVFGQDLLGAKLTPILVQPNLVEFLLGEGRHLKVFYQAKEVGEGSTGILQGTMRRRCSPADV